MNKTNIILATLGLSVSIFVAYTLHLNNLANEKRVLDSLVTLEFTKAGMVAPGLKIQQPASVHIITDENNSLISVQVIPISDEK